MRKRGIMKLSLIDNESKRKTTFTKRKRVVMKKVHELTTLCGVQACAVIYSPYLSVPEAWPSREGVKEVASKFMEMPTEDRTKHMLNQETYLRMRIAKGKEKLKKLFLANREAQVRQFMFDCVQGKMSEYHYDARDLYDLQIYIQQYIDQLTRRMEILTENGESSSFNPFPDGVADDPTDVANVITPFVGSDASTITAPVGFYDHIQYQNMTQSQEPVQHQVSTNFLDLIQYQHMNMNQYQQEPVQYQAPTNIYDQFQHGTYDTNLNSNQYPNQQESFMNMIMEQHMGYGGGHASIPFMDGDNYNYNHLPTDDLATTDHMPSNTSTTEVYAPYNNNNM